MSESSKEKTAIAYRFRGYLPVVIDVETAGFNAQTDALLEVAAQIIDMDEKGNLVPTRSQAVNLLPFEGANLEKSALEFTGIDPYNPLRGAVDEKEGLGSIFQMIRQEVKRTGCNRAILIGHNASFDLGFINAAVERADVKRNPFHPFSTLDTASLSALTYGHTVLKKSCDLAKIEFDNSKAHSALYDTQKTAELFCKIVNRYKELGGWPLPAPLSTDHSYI